MSEGFRASSGFVDFIVPHLREDFFLVDVGCSGGIDPCWRGFGPRLKAVGFDPNVIECERLAQAETLNVKYEPAFVAAPPAHFNRNPWARLSVVRAQQIRAAKEVSLSNDQLTQQNLWTKTRLSERTIDLREYLAGADVDFVKIDIDGPDYGVLRSIPADKVLGFALEVNFMGGVGEDEHTFHNTDRYMRGLGFDLFFLSTRRYSIAALPSRFLGPHPLQTEAGRPIQGDAIYLRDAAADRPALRRDKVLKLAGALVLANQHDTAAELLLAYGAEFLEIDLTAALDTLAQEVAGRTYAEHMASFEADGEEFYQPWR